MIESGIISSSFNINPLDYIPTTNFAAAYSVRLLSSAYKSFALNLRRSSDNATTDVSFDGKNTVSLTSPVSAGGNLGTWLGASDGFVVTWYDQSGNGNNATNAVTTKQPQLASAGVILTQNSKPSLHYYNDVEDLVAPNSSSINLTSTMTVLFIVSFDAFPGAVATLIDRRDNTATAVGYTYFTAPNLFGMQWNTNTTGASVTQTATITTAILYQLAATATVNSTVTMYESHTNLGTGTLSATGSTSATAPLHIGGHKDNPALMLEGYLSEVIVLNSLLSTQQLNSITNNQRNFYSIS